jgi:hypothetical protein
LLINYHLTNIYWTPTRYWVLGMETEHWTNQAEELSWRENIHSFMSILTQKFKVWLAGCSRFRRLGTTWRE